MTTHVISSQDHKNSDNHSYEFEGFQVHVDISNAGTNDFDMFCVYHEFGDMMGLLGMQVSYVGLKLGQQVRYGRHHTYTTSCKQFSSYPSILRRAWKLKEVASAGKVYDGFDVLLLILGSP